MKAASGELSLTVITIVAIGLVIAFFTTALWPRIQGNIDQQWTDLESGAGHDMIILK